MPFAKTSSIQIVACAPPKAERGNVARSCLHFVGYVTAYPRHSANAPSGLATLSPTPTPLYAVLRQLCPEPDLRGHRVLY
jgi:hypothetical protein